MKKFPTTMLLTCLGPFALCWSAETVDIMGEGAGPVPPQVPPQVAPEDAEETGVVTPNAGELADAAEYAREGLRLMQESDQQPALVVDAAVSFLMARDVYQRAADHEAVRGLNANLFWCKKRMTESDIDRYQAQVSSNPRLGQYHQAYEAAEAAVDAGQAGQYLADAKTFAQANPQEHYQVSVRYFEVAERFAGSQPAVEAQRLSLQALEAYMQYQQERRLAERATIFQRKPDIEPGAMVIPSDDATKSAIKELQVLFAEEYRGRKDHERRALAKQLISKAEGTHNDPPIKYAMLSEALSLAQDANDPWLVIQAVDVMAAGFQGIDATQAKIDGLRRVRDPAAKAMTTLLENPNDPSANTDAGKFVCFVSRRWDEGFKLLLAGDDETLKRVAEMELEDHKDTAELLQLADAWSAAADDMRREKDFMYGAMARALRNYNKVAPQLDGISKNRVSKKIDELNRKLPLEYQEVDWDALTVDQWNKIRGKTVEVEAKLYKTRTTIRLGPGQKVRLVPHPTDQWSFRDTWDNDAATCTGYGTDDMRAWGRIYRRSARRNGRGTFRMGEVCASVDDTDTYFKRDDVTGPGLLYLRPYVGSYNSYVGDGVVRVKVIPFEE